MGEQKPEKTKKHICAGLLAHVFAGMTYLLYSFVVASSFSRQVSSMERSRRSHSFASSSMTAVRMPAVQNKASISPEASFPAASA